MSMVSSSYAGLHPSLSESGTMKDAVVSGKKMVTYSRLLVSGNRANSEPGTDEVDMALVRPSNTPGQSPAPVRKESNVPLLLRGPKRSGSPTARRSTAGSCTLSSLCPEEVERRHTLNRFQGLAVVRPADSQHGNISNPLELPPEDRDAAPKSKFYLAETSTDDIKDVVDTRYDETDGAQQARPTSSGEISEIQRGRNIGFEGIQSNGRFTDEPRNRSNASFTSKDSHKTGCNKSSLISGKTQKDSRSDDIDEPELGITRLYPKISNVEKCSPKDNATTPTTLVTNDEEVSLWKLGLCIFGIVTYMVDVGTDVWAAYSYYKHSDLWWFTWTLVFILVPSVTMTFFSMLWYIQDRKKSSVSPLLWVSRFACLLLQLGLLYRYVCVLVFGVLVRRKQHEKHKWLGQLKSEDSDAALLRLIESFMEAAPQLCLQLYIMTHRGPDAGTFLLVIQILSCVTSLLSLAWALAGYHRTLRLAVTNKHDITYMGSALQFFWRLFTVGTRVLAIAMFTSHFKAWVALMVIHWALMVVWLNLFLGSHFCKTVEGKPRVPLEYIFRLVIAAVYVFEFLNPAEGHTRLRYICYYTLVYIENIVMVVAWYVATKSELLWYGKPVLIVVTCLFFVGIFFMMLYYYKFHPNNKTENHIKLCLTWDYYKDELKPSLDCSKQIETHYV